MEFNARAEKTYSDERAKCCAYVFVREHVYIDFPVIAIDVDVARRLIVEQLLVNAPLFPFSVRLAAIMEL